jgi:hypothetical protein
MENHGVLINYEFYIKIFVLTELQKPEGLTTFGRADELNYIYLNIKFLTLIFSGQFIPAKSGLSHWLFQLSMISI